MLTIKRLKHAHRLKKKGNKNKTRKFIHWEIAKENTNFLALIPYRILIKVSTSREKRFKVYIDINHLHQKRINSIYNRISVIG